ncbi:MAG: tandem-95 repeat protein, partial [Proteobacteria bacterium]|nr:tandem-95 repeat protein [Pseudomonadota bacterium]
VWLNVTPYDTDINSSDTLAITNVDLTGTLGTAWMNYSALNGFNYAPNGAFNYLSAGETATDTMHYTVSDNHGAISTGVMTITVSGVNVAPVASAVSVSTSAYSSVSINPLTAVTDVNLDDTQTLTGLITTSTKGLATFDPTTGLITYAPNDAFDYLSVGKTATDSFQYTVSDGHGGTSTAWATVTVSGVNIAPVATSQSGTVAANSSVWLNVTPYDIDINSSDTLAIVSVDLTGTKGTAWLNSSAVNGFNYGPNGAFSYLSAGETATDTMHYTVSDNHGATSTGVMTITVSGINAAPVAGTVLASTSAYSSVSINPIVAVTDVNLDDTDTITGIVTTSTRGSATFDPTTGLITYAPNDAFDYLGVGQTATDSFQYVASDNQGGTSMGWINVVVSGVNVPPVANPDSATITANTAYVNVAPLANDTDSNRSDTLTVVSVDTTGTQGQVIFNTTYNTFTYEPHQVFAYLSAGESASDTFQYTISDGQGGTSTATETIIITGVNAAPVAATVLAPTDAYTSLTINALQGVTDVNLDDIETITGIVTTSTKGSAIFDPTTGLVSYSPNDAFDYLSAGQTATDSFQYTVADDHGGTSTGWVNVLVSGVNVAPVATSQSGSVSAYSSIWLNVAPYDTDINASDTLSIISFDLTGTQGTAWFNPAATNGFNYAPNGAFNYLSAGETATDTLHYTVSDNHGATSTGVVTITVSGVNKNPVAANSSGSTYGTQSETFNVLANATDVNRDDVLT